MLGEFKVTQRATHLLRVVQALKVVVRLKLAVGGLVGLCVAL